MLSLLVTPGVSLTRLRLRPHSGHPRDKFPHHLQIKVSFLSLHTSSISDRYPSRYDSFRHSMNFTRFANCSAAISHSGFGHCLVNTNSCWAIRSKSCIRRQRFPKYRPYVAIHRVALICARFTNSLCILIPRTAFFALCFTCASYSILLRRASCCACFTAISY